MVWKHVIWLVEAAIRFVSEKSKYGKLKSYSSNSNEDVKEESKEPHYNEDKDQLEGEKLEEQTGEIIRATTMNHVF
jgi:hypothetical protein